MVDFADSEVVGSAAEVVVDSLASEPPAMVKGFEYWNCSGSESSWSLMP